MKNVFKLGKRTRTILRFTVSLTLITWLLSKVDMARITNLWGEANWYLMIPMTLGLHLSSVTLKSVRLRKLLQNLDVDFPVWWLSHIQLKANFVRTFFPGGISGDIYRSFTIGRKTKNGSESVSTILVEKILGIVSTLMLAIGGLFIGIYWIDYSTFGELIRPVAIGSIIIFVLFLILFIIIRAIPSISSKITSRILSKLNEVSTQFSLCFTNTVSLFYVFLLSILIQFVIIAWYFVIAKGMYIDISFLSFMIIIPLVELMIMLPVSIGGIGVREGAFAILLLPFGVTVNQAISFSLLSFMIVSVVRTLMGLAFLFEVDHKVQRVGLEGVRGESG